MNDKYKPQALFIIVFLLALIFDPVQAEEAQADKRPHPVLTHAFKEKMGDVEWLKKQVNVVMQMDERQLVALLPRQVPGQPFNCPKCREGKAYDPKYDGQSPKKMPNHWSPDRPDHIQCAACETVFPNETYSLNKTEVFHNLNLEPITVKSYFDPDKNGYGRPGRATTPKGRSYYLDAYVDHARWDFLWPQLQYLAALYHQTQDENYARKAVLIANQYATNFQDFLLNKDRGRAFVDCAKGKFPYGYVEARWGHIVKKESMEDFVRVIDLIYGSRSMDEVSEELGMDVRKNLFKPPASGIERRLTMMAYGGSFSQSAGLKKYLATAQVFENADLVRLVMQTFYDMPRYAYASDGSFWEGTGYSQIQSLNVGRLREVTNFSDPERYQGEDRFDNFDHWTLREDFYRKTYFARSDIRYPNGYVPVSGDGHPMGRIWPSLGPRQSSHSLMKTGYKYAILGDGVLDDQIHVHMPFGTDAEGHSNFDSMGLHVYGFGHGLTHPYSYHGSPVRALAAHNMTHNTVVVDYLQQNKDGSDGAPKLFETSLPGLQVLSVDAPGAYTDANVYKRTLVLNTIEVKKPYVIDVFEVAGGKVHDYHMNTSTYIKQTASSSLALEAMAGGRPLLLDEHKAAFDGRGVPKGTTPGYGYHLLFDAKTAKAQPYGYVDFTCKDSWDLKQVEGYTDWKYFLMLPHKFDPTSWPERANVGMRHHVIGQTGQQVYIADVPAMNRAGFVGEIGIDPIDWKNKQPHMVLRSEPAGANSKSLFVVVHEPFYGKSKIGRIKQLDIGDSDVLALEIPFADGSGRKDLFVYSLSGQPVQVRHGDLSFDGVMGLVAGNKQGQADGYLIGGTKLAKGDKISLESSVSAYTGQVIGSSRKWDFDQKENSFIVSPDMALPEGRALHGKWIMLAHHGEVPLRDPRSEIKVLRTDEGVNEWGLNAAAIKKRWFKQPAKRKRPKNLGSGKGGGHCFEIDYVEKRDGQTVVHVKEDHGLIMKDGKTEEYFFPCRTYPEGSTFTIHSAVATRVTPRVFPPGGTFMERLQVTLRSNDADHPLLYAITAPGDSPSDAELKPYGAPITITASCDLHVRGAGSGNFEGTRFQTYSFNKALPPSLPTAKGLTPGLRFENWVGRDSKSIERVVETVGATKKELADLIKMRFSGYLKVEASGIYTFNYTADRNGSLMIDDKELLAVVPGVLAVPTSRVVEVALEKGMHKIEMNLENSGVGTSRWYPFIKLEWANDEMPRQEVSAGYFYH